LRLLALLFPFLAWCLLLALFSALEWSRIGALELNDTDDYMRLVQVREFVDSGDWYDTRVERLNPPTGTVLHWSRLPDLPLAATLVLLQPLVGQTTATITAVTVVPAFLLLVTAYLLWGGLRISALPEAAGTGVLFLFLCIPVLARSMPGKLDHHNWQLLLMAAFWCSLVLAVRRPADGRACFLAAVAMGLSLWVGLETLPFLAVVYLLMGLTWVLQPDSLGRFHKHFPLALAGFATLLLPLHVRGEALFASSCDSLALNWLLLLWLAAGYFGLLDRICTSHSVRRRLQFAVGYGALIGLPVLYLDLACIPGGPYGNLPDRMHTELLALIMEAQPAHRFLVERPSLFIVLLGFPLLVVGGALLQRSLLRDDGVARLTIILAITALLLSFWQIRSAYFACLFASPLAAMLAQRMLDQSSGNYSPLMPPLAILLLLSPMPALALGAGVSQLGWDSSPSDGIHLGVPEVDVVARVIGTQADFQGDLPAHIVAPINWGPALLARTPHSVLAAPYHRNHQGIIKLLDLKKVEKDGEAHRLLVAYDADFLLLPRAGPETGTETFFDRLARGQSQPWLQGLPVPDHPDILLFRLLR
jgi:hypothetical protein